MSSPVEEQTYTAWFHTPVIRAANPYSPPPDEPPGEQGAIESNADNAMAAPCVGCRTDGGGPGD
jgi:hypothetical protein